MRSSFCQSLSAARREEGGGGVADLESDQEMLPLIRQSDELEEGGLRPATEVVGVNSDQ
jgi:hypothetical protein